jgi:hypothetical protein
VLTTTTRAAAGASGTRHSPRPLLGERLMHNSGAIRAARMRRCISPSLRAKRSNPFFFGPHELLRGACHRARIRAARWLAMTISKHLAPWLLENRIGLYGKAMRAPDAAQRVALAAWCAADPGSMLRVNRLWIPAQRCTVKNAAPRPGHVLTLFVMTACWLFETSLFETRIGRPASAASP